MHPQERWCLYYRYGKYRGQENDYVRCIDLIRNFVCVHPWRIGGGGAGEPATDETTVMLSVVTLAGIGSRHTSAFLFKA